MPSFLCPGQNSAFLLPATTYFQLLGAALADAPLADDIQHAVLPVFKPELRASAAGNTVARPLGAVKVVAPLADDVHHAVLFVSRAEYRLY